MFLVDSVMVSQVSAYYVLYTCMVTIYIHYISIKMLKLETLTTISEDTSLT